MNITVRLIQPIRFAALAASAFFCASVAATPPNITAAASVPYEVGQGWVTHYFDEAVQTRWFRFGETMGRSYCVEAVQGSVSPIQLDPNLNVYTDATGATVLASNGALTNNDGGGDPFFIKGSRICYISPLAWNVPSAIRAIKLNVPITAGSGDSGNIRLRVVETTLFADLLPFSNPAYGEYGSTYSCTLGLTNISQAAIKVGTATVNAGATFQGGCVSGTTVVPHNGPPGSLRGMGALYVNEQAYDPVSGSNYYKSPVLLASSVLRTR